MLYSGAKGTMTPNNRLQRTALRQKERNRNKSRIRARGEHAFGVIKGVFKFTKVRYRGLAKNGTRAFVACALANLFMARGHLLRNQWESSVQNKVAAR